MCKGGVLGVRAAAPTTAVEMSKAMKIIGGMKGSRVLHDIKSVFKDSVVNRSSRMKHWILRSMAVVILWSFCCLSMGIWQSFTPPVLVKNWPQATVSSSDSDSTISAHISSDSTLSARMSSDFIALDRHRYHRREKRVYKNNGYLMVSCNGGLNQMRAAICDMVAIARYLNVTLIVPELDKTSFWADPSDFQDIFDVNHFIDSLRDEVRILKELPPRLKNRVELGQYRSLHPVSWSDLSYYHNQILPLLLKHKVVQFNKTDSRLANNGLPLDIQKLRCRVNYNALKFTSEIEELGRRVISILRQKGPFLVLHLRYEMDMLAFSGCTQGCSKEEADELTKMRYAYPWWKEKVIDSKMKRREGLCPLTPEETALALKALGIDPNIQIYIAAGEIYGGKRRMESLVSAFPNVVRKETLLKPEDLRFFLNHSSQMAALDYIVSLESDIFVPTYDGNMARVVEGHRRFLGYKTTISLNRKLLVQMIDIFNNGSISSDEFSSSIKEAHAHRTGSSHPRTVILDKPKEEDYFYSNPYECLEQGQIDEPLWIA